LDEIRRFTLTKAFDVWMLAMLPICHKQWHCCFIYLYVAYFM